MAESFALTGFLLTIITVLVAGVSAHIWDVSDSSFAKKLSALVLVGVASLAVTSFVLAIWSEVLWTA